MEVGENILEKVAAGLTQERKKKICYDPLSR
jgi:hypothetical protein